VATHFFCVGQGEADKTDVNHLVDRYTFGDREHLALHMAPCLAPAVRESVRDLTNSTMELVKPPTDAPPTVDDLLRMLHPSEGVRDLRAIHDEADPKVIARVYPVSDLAAVRGFVAAHGRQRNLYVGVAPRNREGRSTEHCLALHALFVDLDTKRFASGEA